MNSEVLNQIVNQLKFNTRYNFILDLENDTDEYLFDINNSNDYANLTVKDKKTGHETLINVDDDLFISVNNLKPKKFIEIRVNPRGVVIERNELILRNEIELFIKIFRIMKEQVTFLLKTDNRLIVCYFISGKVFHVEQSGDVYEVHEDNFFRLTSLYYNSEVVLISPLPYHFSCGDFYTIQNKIAKSRNLSYHNNKNGVKTCSD